MLKARRSSFCAQGGSCQEQGAEKEKVKMKVYPSVSDQVSVPRGLPNGTLFVSVDKTFQNPKIPGVSLEDCARGYWTIANLKASHAYDCDYLMARQKGSIVGAWRIDRKTGWHDSSIIHKKTWSQDRPGADREACLLISDEANLGSFIGKRVKLGRCPCSLRGFFED